MSYQTQKETRLTGFDCWQLCTTIQMHFKNEQYDCFQFNFKARHLTPRTFLKRNDQYFFEKHANRFRSKVELRKFIFANIFFAKNTWIGEFQDEPYRLYSGRLQSMSYRFRSDLKALTGHSKALTGHSKALDGLLCADTGAYPPVVSMMLQEKIMTETVIILEHLTRFLNSVKTGDSIFFPQLKQSIQKASPFIQQDVDMKKMRQIALSLFTS